MIGTACSTGSSSRKARPCGSRSRSQRSRRTSAARRRAARACVYFQLKALWRAASQRLEKFAGELAQQQKDRSASSSSRNSTGASGPTGRCRPRTGGGEGPGRPAPGGAEARAATARGDGRILELLPPAQAGGGDGRAGRAGRFGAHGRHRPGGQPACGRGGASAGVPIIERRGTARGEPGGHRLRRVAVRAAGCGRADRPVAADHAAPRLRLDYGAPEQCEALLRTVADAIGRLDKRPVDLVAVKARTDRLRGSAVYRSNPKRFRPRTVFTPPDPRRRAGPVEPAAGRIFDLYRALLR